MNLIFYLRIFSANFRRFLIYQIVEVLQYRKVKYTYLNFDQNFVKNI